MKKTIILITLGFMLMGCGSSEKAIQTAIAETEAANPTTTSTQAISETPTITPSPTFTLTPSETPTVTASPTKTETPTPTPDLRVIAIESKAFLLTSDDLPKEAKYYLPNSNWISPHHNSEIISGWGEEKGRAYLAESGRIDGWWVWYDRGTKTVIAPANVYHNIIQYKTAKGAQISITKHNCIVRNDCDAYSFVERDYSDLGDVSIGMINKEMQSNGKNRVWYYVETAYRNYVSIVAGWGWEDEVEYEYVENIAQIALEKLKAAPLVDSIP